MKKQHRIFYLMGTFVVACLSIIFISCNSDQFKSTTKIIPELEQIGSKIAVQFKLGDLLVLDEWADFNAAEVLYLTKKRNKKDPITLRITAGDWDGVYFYYSTGSLEITTKPVTWDILSKHVDSFPNVRWLMKKGLSIPKDEQTTKKEIKLKPMGNTKTKKLEALE